MLPLPWPPPDSDNHDPQVMAQQVCADSGWQIDGSGLLYDHRGVYLAADLMYLASAMKHLRWIEPATGIDWDAIPPQPDHRSAAVKDSHHTQG